MKIDKLVKRVTDHIDKMPALGLGGWDLHISIVDSPSDGAGTEAVASCACSTHYDTMWLEFGKEWLKHASDEEIDKTIIHELIHATFRDFDHVIGSVTEFLGEPHRSAFADAYKHELEGVVEKLARTLNLTYREDVVQSP